MQQVRSSKKLSIFILTAALVAWAIPFFLYWALLAASAYPDAAAWSQLGMNHGPWRWEPPGITFLVCIFALLCLGSMAVLHGLYRSYLERALQPMLIPLLIAGLCVALLWHQITSLFWLID